MRLPFFALGDAKFACLEKADASLKICVKSASERFCNAFTAAGCQRTSGFVLSCAISRSNRVEGNLSMSSSVDFWYYRMSRAATCPGLHRADLTGAFNTVHRAALAAITPRRALPPVYVRAGWLVRAMVGKEAVWSDF